MKKFRGFLRGIAKKRNGGDYVKPWEQFFLNLANIFTIKAIISMVVVFIFCYKIFTGAEINGYIQTIFAVVVTYWLCEKTKGKEDE